MFTKSYYICTMGKRLIAPFAGAIVFLCMRYSITFVRYTFTFIETNFFNGGEQLNFARKALNI